MSLRSDRIIVRMASLFVPGDRRAEWLEEWIAEVDTLRSSKDGRLPGALGFAAGALPHALWMRTEGWTMDSVLQDIRYSTRVLRRAPGFTLVATLTLALGIGANAAIFSLVNGLVLRAPAGVVEPERLVQIGRSYESAPRWDSFSWPAMRLIGEESRTLDGVAGYSGQAFVLGRGMDTERVVGQIVSGNYFDVLGVAPHIGRLLQPTDDERPGAHRVLVLDHGLWQRRFGGDPAIVGASIDVGGEAWEVVGVTPEGFHGVDNLGFHPEVYASLMMNPSLGENEPLAQWGWSWINVVGRMQDGVSFEETVAAMEVVSTRLRDATEENDDMLAVAVPGVGLDPDGREAAGQIALMLGVIALLVLLLTCTNVANLFLSRSASRSAEVGVRLALGAARPRLARQLMTESGLLAVGATLLAVPIVATAGDVLPLLFPTPLATSLHADGRVYAFLAGTGLLTGLLFGVAPAWSWSRRDVALTLREGASTALRGGTRMRDALVVVQLGLSLALVTGASLLGRSVMNARSADPGFETHGLAAASVDLFSTGRYDEASGRAFFEALVREAEGIPGMEVTLASQIPIAGGHARASVRPSEQAPGALSFEAEYTVVGPRYFETMGMPIVRGRGLGGFGEEPEPVVVVNEALAMLFWPGDDAVGKSLWTRGGESRIVGVVPDVQMRSLRTRGNPAVYHPIDQSYLPSLLLHMRGTDGQLPTPEILRGAVSAIDSEIPVSRVYDVEAAMVTSMSETRTIGYLVGVFAILALLLAAVGLYGLVAFAASQRVREFGIRIALGSRPEEVTRLVLGRGLTVAMLGIGFGLVVSYALGRALQSLLFGVAPADPVTFSGAAMVLLLAAALAAWLPARRAGRLDAAISLRE